MKRIVVTGSKGGTGRSIVKVLRAAGYDVIGVDIHPRCIDDPGEYVQLNLTDAAGANDVFAGADAVVHFGSPPSDQGMSRTEAFEQLTVAGFNVLQAASNTGIKRIAWASSIEVYGDRSDVESLPLTEEGQLKPMGIYGASKVILEQLAQQYCRWHGMSIACLRLGRIIYEGSYAWRLKPHTETDASAASVLWSYIDARDVAEVCRLWLESNLTGFRAYNLAADDTCIKTPTRQLIQNLYPHITDLRGNFADQTCPFSSIRIMRELNWKPQHNWRQIRAEAESSCRHMNSRPTIHCAANGRRD